MKKANSGFTLIELMLVVIIISILAAAVAPRLVGRSEQAKVATAIADIKSSIPTALDLYEVDNGRFPASNQGLEALRTKLTEGPAADTWRGPYIKERPVDPWGSEYQYAYPGTHNNDYDLFSPGPDGIEGNEDDIVNWEA